MSSFAKSIEKEKVDHGGKEEDDRKEPPKKKLKTAPIFTTAVCDGFDYFDVCKKQLPSKRMTTKQYQKLQKKRVPKIKKRDEEKMTPQERADRNLAEELHNEELMMLTRFNTYMPWDDLDI